MRRPCPRRRSQLRQRSNELREKELKLFNNNFSAVATQAAVMAGFTLTSFVEIDLPPNKQVAKALLHFFVTTSICVNFLCVAMVTFVTVWGGGYALRGRDGAMDFAVDEMNAERGFIFACFGVGVLSTLGCLLSAAWVLMEFEIAVASTVLIVGTMYLVVSEARRIKARFVFQEHDVVKFDEFGDNFPRVVGGAVQGGTVAACGGGTDGSWAEPPFDRPVVHSPAPAPALLPPASVGPYASPRKAGPAKDV